MGINFCPLKLLLSLLSLRYYALEKELIVYNFSACHKIIIHVGNSFILNYQSLRKIDRMIKLTNTIRFLMLELGRNCKNQPG